MPAAEGFVPLATWLRAVADPAVVAAAPVAGESPALPSVPPETRAAGAESAPAEALRDVRLFRARLADALDAAAGVLVRELAYAVLGRELHLAPADIGELARRILAEHPAAVPLRIRHAAGDRLESPVPTLADAQLEPGDLIVEFVDGDLDARIGVRLDVALEAWS